MAAKTRQTQHNNVQTSKSHKQQLKTLIDSYQSTKMRNLQRWLQLRDDPQKLKKTSLGEATGVAGIQGWHQLLNGIGKP